MSDDFRTPFLAADAPQVPYNGQAFVTDDVDCLTSETRVIEIPRHFDFLDYLYLEIDWIHGSDLSTSFNQGHALIDYVDLLAGSDILVRETGASLYLRTLITDARPGAWDSPGHGINALLGGRNWKDLSVYPRTAEKPYTLRVPLLFFFFGKTPFPLCALRFHELAVRVRFRKSDVFLASDPGKELSMVIRLRMEGGYLDDARREAFLSRGHDYVMDEFHIFEYDTKGDREDIIRPDFFNPSKALFFTCQDSVFLKSDDLFNYARDNTRIERDLFKSVKVVVQGNVVGDHEVLTHDFARTSQFHYSYPGGPRLDLNALVYALNFCMRPLELQPTAHLLLNDCQIEVKTNLPLLRGLLRNTVRVTVYSLGINVVRVQGGFAKKLWSSPKNWR